MDSEKKPPRGRARGRSRGVPPTVQAAQLGGPLEEDSPPHGEPEDGAARERRMADLTGMFSQDPPRRTSDEREDSNGNGSNGRGNGNGNGNGHSNGNGNGNGNGANGGSDDGSERGGRGARSGRGSPPEAGNGNGRGTIARGGPSMPTTRAEVARDYVRTRPAPDYSKIGTTGQPIRLVTNFFKLNTHPKFKMSLYAVKIEPPVEEQWKIKQLVRSHSEVLKSYLLTGFQLFTTFELSEEECFFRRQLTCRESDPVDETFYEVKLVYVREMSDSEPLVIQFYNTLVRKIQSGLEYNLLGRHYFDPTKKVVFRSWRLELWPGFQNSIRQQEHTKMLNVESVWKVIRTDNVLSMLDNIKQEMGSTGPDFQERCIAEVRGMMVITQYNIRAYKIDSILFDQNPSATFTKTEKVNGVRMERQISYMDYYKERWNLEVRNPAQPILVSKPSMRDIRRGQIGDILLLPEFCFPCGLTESLRSNFRLMKDLASCLHMDPGKRVITMKEFVGSINSNETLTRTLREWNIKINREPEELAGRSLPPQEIMLGRQEKIRGDDKADWTMGLRGKQMLSTVRLDRWVVIVTQRDSQGMDNLLSTMNRVATPLGYEMNRPERIFIPNASPQSYEKGIQQAMAKLNGQVDLMFVVLGSNSLETYSKVKVCCTRNYGIPSQCFLAKNLSNKGLMSICTKMVIQMNAKQGGEPWGVLNPMKTCMVLGYDVHHAGAGGGASVGAMCATVSATLGQYYSCIDRITDRQEVATTVSRMFEKCLEAYRKRNGAYPARVMMYRDGVGEGQLRDVYESEVSGFKEKMERLYTAKGEEVGKLTFIIVNKRINTRFFLSRGGQGFQNPMPGTIVDDVVTLPERYDFFLISQTARQGCVSPTYYNVIYDDSKLPPDKLQVFTYRLCHLYFNWSGTVAVPGPCQNAHKYAFQAGTALKGPAHSNLDMLLHYL